MEALFSEGAKVLFQQGTGWVLFVFAVLAAVYLYREHKTYQKDVEKWKDDQFEKRLSERNQTVDALNRASTALIALEASLGTRTEAINALTTGFAEMARDTEANRDKWQDRMTVMAKTLDDIERRIEAIQMGRAA